MPVPCPLFTGDPAVSFVNDGWTTMKSYGFEAFNMAVDALNSLSAVSVTPITFSASYNVNGTLSGFHRPATPPAPSIVYNTAVFDGLGDPPEANVADPQFITINPFNVPTPYYNAPTKPLPLPASTVGAVPALTPITACEDIMIPCAPEFVDPVLGTMLPVTLPVMMPINIPVFTAQPPIANFVPPTGEITFLPTHYTDSLLDEVKAQISFMMEGGTGLPAAVEAALFSRGRGREDMAAAKATQDVREDFAARGFSIPPGAAAARLMEIRQNTQNKSASLSRDVYIQAQTVAVENMRFAVTQAIAYEQMMITYDIALQNMLLQSQQIALEMMIAMFNAQIAMFNAQQQAYAIAAQVYRDQIQAELAKVEIYKAQLDAQRLIGEINQQTITIYSEQIKATMMLVERYKAELEAVNLIREGDRLAIEAYKAKLQARETEVRAWAVEWEGYKAQIDGQIAESTFYTALVNGYAQYVNAIAQTNNNQVALTQSRVQLATLDLEGWKAELQFALGKLEGEKTRIMSLTSLYDAQAKIYQASASVESAAADVDTRQFQALVENQKAQVDTYLKSVEMSINQLVQLSAQIIETRKAVAQVSSQLAASSFSAVHFGAQAGSSNSRSMSSDCSVSTQYSGAA